MKTADTFLQEAAETFRARNKVYGDNYKNVGAMMAALFPFGISVVSADDWNRLHILLLSVVKVSRYCNNWSSGGHPDSIHDAAVYNAMLESIDFAIKADLEKAETMQKEALQDGTPF